MWDNVGEMPLEIFGDYLTDILNEEWSWEYLALTFNFNGTPGSTFGIGNSLNGLRYNWHCGDGLTNDFSHMKQDCDYGDGYSYNLGEISLNSNGRQ